VNTVTTLGATFSTTGAKVAITPGCFGEGSCALTESALVDAQNMAPISNPKDRKIPLCIKRFPHQVNRALDGTRLLLLIQLAAKVERVVLNAFTA
jgi:hypothetical protein